METAPKKLKILYLITKGSWGGAQRYVYDLATGVPSDSFETVVASGEGEDLFRKLEEKSVRTILLPNLTRDVRVFNDLKTIINLISIFKKEKPDIIHSNSSKMGFLATVAGRICHIKKIIFTAHGWAFNENRGWLSRKIFIIVQWLTVVLSGTTIAVSEKTRSDILRMPGMTGKVIAIHNGITPPEFIEKTEARAFLGHDIKNNFWVGTVAELHKNKGIDCLILGFAKFTVEFPESSLVIVGDGEERRSLEKLANDKNIGDKVHFLGRISQAEKYIKAFDVFALTSRTEALPYVVLEAGLSGVPIVASRVGGIPEIITSLKTGILVRPGDEKEIYLALLHITKDATDAKHYAKTLAPQIERKFSLGAMTRKTLVLYKK